MFVGFFPCSQTMTKRIMARSCFTRTQSRAAAMSDPIWKRGDQLTPALQKRCLAMFVHRYTRDHTPAWAKEARPNGQPYPVQFASDSDWLAHSLFAVSADGARLDRRVRHCESSPTWPDGKEETR